MKAMPLLLLAFAAISAWTGETLTPEAYLRRLADIDGALESGNFEQAKELSGILAGLTVAWPQGPLHGDPTIAVLVNRSAMAAARLRVQADLAVLALSSGATPTVGDAQALARIASRADQAAWRLRSGGDIAGIPQDVQLSVTWQDRVFAALTWVRDVLRDAIDWLRNLLRLDRGADGGHGDGGSLVLPISLVLVGIILVLAVVMAWRTWRSAPAPVLESIGSEQKRAIDADPRSRAVDEWQTYAQRLITEGRYREATRAWYHALLVQCWSNGLIHHRVGKTNWEYALLLPAGLSWRDRFRDLTLRYDRIWYGYRDDADTVGSFSHDAGDILAMLRRDSAGGA